MPACPADEGFGDEVPDGKGMGITVVGESVKFVALLPMLDPDLLIAHSPDQHQALVEVNVVCLQLGRELRVASKVIIVITDHHSDLDACTSSPELIENGLVRLYYVL